MRLLRFIQHFDTEYFILIISENTIELAVSSTVRRSRSSCHLFAHIVILCNILVILMLLTNADFLFKKEIQT